MKTLITVFLLGMVTTASAEWVRPHTRKDGTQVDGYYRTPRDGNPYNNQSYPDNYNYNTGQRTTGSQAEYIQDYYYKPIKRETNCPTIDYLGQERKKPKTTTFGDWNP